MVYNYMLIQSGVQATWRPKVRAFNGGPNACIVHLDNIQQAPLSKMAENSQ